MSELEGPKRSKKSIDQFESWLKERCRNGPVKVKTIECEYQYLSGHEPRKIREYLHAIESSGRIRLSFNGGAEYCEWTGEIAIRPEVKPPPEKLGSHVVETKVVGGAEVRTGRYVDKEDLRKKLRQKLEA